MSALGEKRAMIDLGAYRIRVRDVLEACLPQDFPRL